MDVKADNPFEGTIGLNWPGKYCKLVFANGKWRLIPYGQTVIKRALLFEGTISTGENTLGYIVKGDAMSSLESLRPYAINSVKFIYFDSPRIDKFQPYTDSGYGVSTWLSLIQQVAGQSAALLSHNGFFALHTDEQTSHYARVVLDEVFGQARYIGTFAWQKQYSPQNDLNVPTDVLDYITIYSKTPAAEIEKIGVFVTPKGIEDDGDFRGCFVAGHKGARSGSEATKFKVNTSPYHWEILESNLPEGNYHFDKILGSLWFDGVCSTGDYFVKVKATDKRGRAAERIISFTIRDRESVDDEYSLPNRIWWLLKNDNDIVSGGDLQINELPAEQLVGIKGQQFSLVFKASGGEPFTMKSDSPGLGRYWEFGLKTLIEAIAQARASFGNTGGALPSIKKYYERDNAKKLQTVINYLSGYEYGHTQDATQHCKSLKSAGITCGEVNMMAKPQKLLSHLISLFAPNHDDLVLSLGDPNAVFASVATKLHRRFIHVVGGSNEDKATWENTAFPRLVATIEQRDNAEIEGNDALPDANPQNGRIVVLKMSKSNLAHNSKNGDIEPNFSDDETVEDFYAGLAGAYRQDVADVIYKGLDKRSVYVVPCEESLDAVGLDKIKRMYPDPNLTVIYEISEEDFASPKNVTLRRAPFDLI